METADSLSYQNPDGTAANVDTNTGKPYMPRDYVAVLEARIWGQADTAVTVQKGFTISVKVYIRQRK